jgi:hypothetical protein
MLVAASSTANLGTQRIVDLSPGAVVAPAPEIMMDAFPLRIFLWQHSPLDAAHHHVQNGIDYQAHIERARTASGFCQWDQIADMIPLAVGQVAWI